MQREVPEEASLPSQRYLELIKHCESGNQVEFKQVVVELHAHASSRDDKLFCIQFKICDYWYQPSLLTHLDACITHTQDELTLPSHTSVFSGATLGTW